MLALGVERVRARASATRRCVAVGMARIVAREPCDTWTSERHSLSMFRLVQPCSSIREDRWSDFLEIAGWQVEDGFGLCLDESQYFVDIGARVVRMVERVVVLDGE